MKLGMARLHSAGPINGPCPLCRAFQLPCFREMLFPLTLTAVAVPLAVVLTWTRIVTAEDRSSVSTLDPLYRPYAARNGLKQVTIHDHVYGTRNVSYFTVDDLAVIDGDVIYGTVDDLLSKDVRLVKPDHQAHQLSERAFSVFNTSIWPNGIVTYRYESDATADLLTWVVDGAIARWQELAPYLTFNRLFPNSNVTTRGILVIRAPVCGGCNSYVGYNYPRPVMNLQQSCPSSPGGCWISEATHEFGHALGKSTRPERHYDALMLTRRFTHEHHRPDRAGSVNFLCQNVNPGCPSGTTMPEGKTCCDTGLPTGCCSAVSNFALLGGPAYDANWTYDASSLMHYRSNAFAISGLKTLTPAASGVYVPTSNPPYPSRQDSDRICKLYQRICPKAMECIAAGCPATCEVIEQCDVPACSDPDPPPCCDAETYN